MITAITSIRECHDCLCRLGYSRRMRRPQRAYRDGVAVVVCLPCLRAEQQADDAPGAPTREEIAERAAAIRAEWSAGETVRRLRHDWRVAQWEAPEVRLSTGQAVLP